MIHRRMAITEGSIADVKVEPAHRRGIKRSTTKFQENNASIKCVKSTCSKAYLKNMKVN
jgi:hypothetical protein